MIRSARSSISCVKCNRIYSSRNAGLQLLQCQFTTVLNKNTHFIGIYKPKYENVNMKSKASALFSTANLLQNSKHDTVSCPPPPPTCPGKSKPPPKLKEKKSSSSSEECKDVCPDYKCTMDILPCPCPITKASKMPDILLIAGAVMFGTSLAIVLATNKALIFG